MPAFVGLDLAWTPGRPSGICVLSSGGDVVRMEHVGRVVMTPTALARQVATLGSTVYAAIDAPLVVSPDRRAEALLARRYGDSKAFAFHTSREWLSRNNALAGPQLAEALGVRGFRHQGPPTARADGRYMLEVFPHAAHVSLFGLAERLSYKRGVLTARAAVMAIYQRELDRLLRSSVPELANDTSIQRLLEPCVLPVTGSAMKLLEDQLDALTCAIVAHHAWKAGPAGLDTFGCAEHGQITVPRRLDDC
jgi:predicted RNase H-like nuclease